MRHARIGRFGSVLFVVMALLPTEPEPGASDGYSAALANVILHAPSCTIRGGTKEVLRGIVAKSLGLR